MNASTWPNALRYGFQFAFYVFLLFTKANQVVPDWLEEVAETALGTGYGPKGGRYGGTDTRKVFPTLSMFFL